MAVIAYPFYSNPTGGDTRSFLLAHRMSKSGPAHLKDVARVEASTQRGLMFLGWTGTVLSTCVAGSTLLVWPNVKDKVWSLIGCGTGGPLSVILALHARSRMQDLIDEHDLQNLYLNPVTYFFARSHNSSKIENLISSETSASVTFTPQDFEHERIYYEQALAPYLNSLIKALAGADEAKIHSKVKAACKLLEKKPLPEKFSELNEYDLKSLQKPLKSASHPNLRKPESIEFNTNQRIAILDHLDRLQQLIGAVKQSQFGYIEVDADMVERLRDEQCLPRGRLEFRLEQPPNQPNPTPKADHIRDTHWISKWLNSRIGIKDLPPIWTWKIWGNSYNSFPANPGDYPDHVRISKKGSALYGNAIVYQYRLAHRARWGGGVASIALILAFYYSCKWTLQTLSLESGTNVVVKVLLPLFGITTLVATEAMLDGQWQMWQIEKESPWAVNHYPKWLSEVGLRRAADYLKWQARLSRLL